LRLEKTPGVAVKTKHMNIKISLLRISATLVPCGLKNQHEAPKRTPVLLSDKTPLDTDLKTGTKSVDYLKIYRDGIIRNVLNSKVALFFIAFLPQFIDPALKKHRPAVPCAWNNFYYNGDYLVFDLGNFCFHDLRQTKRQQQSLHVPE